MVPSVKSLTQTQATQKNKSKPPSRAKTVRLDGESPSSSGPSKLRRIDPLTAFSRHLTPASTPTPPPQSLKGKGKAKEQSNVKSRFSSSDGTDDFLWVDKYEPITESQLAVHVKKVEDVRRWISEAFDGGPSGKLKKYRRILALTGPAGTGKTTTIRVLSQELGFEILEWRNSIAETPFTPFGEDGTLHQDVDGHHLDFDTHYESLFTKFEAFLTRASTCNNIFDSCSSNMSQDSTKRRLILLEDFPNILHPMTQIRFHAALKALVTSPPSDPPVPVIVVISDSGLRGEVSDERRADGGSFGKDKAQVVDVRTVLSKDLLGGPYVTEIGFNPIAPTLMRKALQAMINTHFASSNDTNSVPPSKDILDIIVESANGDIRSAIMALQFACVVEMPGGKKKKAKAGSALVLEAVTRREQSLALFHLLGKVLYNKRKDDPPGTSATAKDIQKERNIDALLKDPIKLPPHLQHHNRRTSRLDVDTLYVDSPIESSLFSLYIHQNYTQFCNELGECEGIADWLSWVDSSGGDAWYLANPHQFHLLTLGTIHCLPSPVPRRSQKYYKPEFFSFLQKEKDSWNGVRATRDWMTEGQIMNDSRRACGWTKIDIALELGGILKANDHLPRKDFNPPHLHRLFSRMEYSRTSSGAVSQQLDERDEVPSSNEFESEGRTDDRSSPPLTKEQKGGWLESDDIETFD